MKLAARVAPLCLLLGLTAAPATAQTIPGWDCKQLTLERIDADRVRVACNHV
jgi:hypothetical protein